MADEMTERRILTVTELTRTVRGLLETAIGEVWVEGEVSNYRRQASGHQYFTLKDDGAQLSCVWFRGRAGSGRLGQVALTDGQQVQVLGELTVYEARGQYQMNVRMVQPRGAGALQARFEALKRQLAAEGLFDAERKQLLPQFPTRIGIVTSPTGAAVRDMLNVLHRRAPWIEILVSPARVQGEGAAEEVAAAVAELNRWQSNGLPRVDVIVVGRGGGSLEDLWAFNEEVLARAIAASEIPVVSAVGHEIDFTIADFVADLRAPTPSAAAELVAPDRAELLRRLEEMRNFLTRRLSDEVERGRGTLRLLSQQALLREPLRRLEEERQGLDDVMEAIARGATMRLEREQTRLAAGRAAMRIHRPDETVARLRDRLEALSSLVRERSGETLQNLRGRFRELSTALRVLGPQATLERGYSITMDVDGKILQSATDAKSGTVLRTRLAVGELRSRVEGG